jgi:peptidoglycan L-alanyl-D-glutamate endopeptidase CwlK
MVAPRKDLEGLKPPFRSAIQWLIFLIEKEGLPLIVFETFRGGERQNALKESGSSKAGAAQSPHNYGLACDFVLDVEKCPVRKREWPEGSGHYYKDAWDYKTAEAKAAYNEFGRLAESIGLEWGGRWKFLDVPHVQMPNWRRHI